MGNRGWIAFSEPVHSDVYAIVCSQMVMAGIRSVIEPDGVIDSMRRIGRLIPECLRETSREGLAITPSAQHVIKKLGPVGLVKFMQQCDMGYGDYTKEKQEQIDISLDEINYGN